MQNIQIGIGILFLFLLVCVVIAKIWTAMAVRKVRKMDEDTKEKRLDAATRPFGFLYDPGQDIFYSKMYPWQRKIGYEKAFDEGALLLSMVIDCEPVYFEYDDRIWLIEFWKGQYGMTTGAEIGVYCTKKPEDYKKGDEKTLHYDSVSDEERLYMQYILYRNGEEIIRRRAEHWWLTAFEPGMFSRPEELSMCIKIIFPRERMCYAFFKSLIEMGYSGREIYMGGSYVTLSFTRPKSSQPVRKAGCLRAIVQGNNRRNCRIYKKRTRMFETDLDKITFLSYRYPLLYRAVLGFRGWRGIRRKKTTASKV